MSTGLSPENEHFLELVVSTGVFPDRYRALDEAVGLLRRRQELLDHIDEGTRQLRNGEGIELRGEDELHAFFENIRAEGRKRYEAARKSE